MSGTYRRVYTGGLESAGQSWTLQLTSTGWTVQSTDEILHHTP